MGKTSRMHNGGRALPKELTLPISEAPSEVKWRANEANRVRQVLAKRRGQGGVQDKENNHSLVVNSSRCDNPKDELFNDLVREIKERRVFQIAMEETDAGNETRQKISLEISSRVQKLKQIIPERAQQFILELNGEVTH